jgi:hypothetical protein
MQTKKERIEIAALVAEIVGAIAVVISVVYLAFQIADSNKELKSQTHFNALTLGQRPIEIELENADLASIVRRGYDAPDELTTDEWYRFSQYQLVALNAWEYYYYENAKKTLPVELWTGANAYYEMLIKTKPGLQRFWSENEHIYAEPFRSYVEDIIAARSASD